MSSTMIAGSEVTLDDLRGNPRRRQKEIVVRTVLFSMALASVVASLAIVLSLFTEAWTFISQVDLSALWSEGWFPRRDLYDLRTVFVATVMVTVIAMIVAVPIGLGAAIYLSEYAKPRVRKVLKPVLEILAGIPSVVLGVFAFTFISPEIIGKIFSQAPQSNLLSAGIAVGILIIPLVASVSEDAMRSVPNSLREASYGMGARRVTTCIKVVIPASVSGLVAAFLLAFSRAMGETMVVLLAAGGGGGVLFTADPLRPGLTMTAAMATQARGTDNIAGAGLAFQSLFFLGLLLFLITLGLNLIAGRFVRRVRHKY